MGKGRAPCCDKSQVKKGPWSPEEDLKLITFIQKHGHENWRALPKQAGLLRCGKSCRLRWINYLRPDLKRGNFTLEEEETIIRLHKALGNKWSKIASCLPGRTDNEIKNVWNTHLKKRVSLASKSSDSSSADESKLESSVTSPSSSSSESFFSNNETPKSTNNPAGSEITEQVSQVTVPEEKIDQDNSEKKVSNNNDPVGIIIEDPKGSSISLSSVESNILNSSQVVEYKTEQQQQQEVLDSALTHFLGTYDATLEAEVVDKPDQLIEIPWDSDYDFWKLIDNIDLEPFGATCPEVDQMSEPQKFGDEISVQVDNDEGRMMWSKEFENEFGVVGEKIIESNKDKFPPNDYQAEPGTTIMNQDNNVFDLDLVSKPESELNFGCIQSWPSSCPDNSTSP